MSVSAAALVGPVPVALIAAAIAPVAAVAILYLGALAASAALRRAPAEARHLVWLAVPVGAAVTPLLHLASLSWRVTIAAEVPGAPAAAHASRLLALWPVWLWATGAAATFAALARGLARVQRISNRATPIATEDWLSLTRRLAGELGVGTAVSVRMTDEEAVPLTWRLRHPVILLPSPAAEWPPERRRAVLLHELAHVGRGDYLTELLLWAVCAAYWFHPAVWRAARRVRAERERACDELVVRRGVPAADYAEHLVEVARAVVSDRRAVVTAFASPAGAALERRIRAILTPTAAPLSPARARALGAAAALAAIAAATLIPGVRPARPAPAPRSTHVSLPAKPRCDCAAKRLRRATPPSPAR